MYLYSSILVQPYQRGRTRFRALCVFGLLRLELLLTLVLSYGPAYLVLHMHFRMVAAIAHSAPSVDDCDWKLAWFYLVTAYELRHLCTILAWLCSQR